MARNGENFQLIDVREPEEYNDRNIGGTLIPLNNILEEADKVSTDRKVLIYCRSGKRSSTAIQQLEDKFGLDNLYNLKGGILDYIAYENSKLNVM
jgi:sulfur-carrier protein adenylyltransferase/sulfurtransferase